MKYNYYIIRKSDNTITYMADDMVQAMNVANELDYVCYILQGCVITELGEEVVAPAEEVELQNESEE
jgi:hypothetical protein